MKVSIDWLKQYVPFDLSVEELADRLTMVGLEVEEIHRNSPVFEGIVVGRIIRVENHPNADKLHLCTVDVGDAHLPIVCGAPNVAENQMVPVARVGAVLPGDKRIRKAKLRGVLSEGMICSEDELGISDNHDGILVLDEKAYRVGQPFGGESKMGSATLEVNITPNRPDCLSHIGVAREISVIVGENYTMPDDSVVEGDEATEALISVEIKDVEACPRYTARVVQDVQIGSSPAWLRERLESVDIRSINNVVDITNYVLMETGQPLHAFDYDLVQGRKIIVRKARDGESFTTLDDVERKLNGDDLLICDGERGVALAGVMGGQNSEVSDRTKTVLLESAYFHPVSIRKTAKRHGLSTEASHRFERGCDPNNTIYAVNRAAKLLHEIAGGSVAKGIVDAYPQTITPWEVALRPSRVASVLGEGVPRKTMIAILEGLDLKTSGEEPIHVSIPTFRPDLTREIDLIEEIVRHYGFDCIQPRLTSTISLTPSSDSGQDAHETFKDLLVGMGFMEIYTNTLVSQKHASLISGLEPIPLQNPVSPETAFLRTSLIPSLLDAVQWNIHRSTSGS